MRHFLLPGPVTALAFGVGVTAAQAVLIAATRGTDRLSAGLVGAPRGAVAVAAIAVAANEHGCAASRRSGSVFQGDPLAVPANGNLTARCAS
jgi:hypothetical protein